MNEDEIEVIHKNRIEKITKLGLKGIASKQILDEPESNEELESINDDKKEMIENVMEAMEDYGDIE